MGIKMLRLTLPYFLALMFQHIFGHPPALGIGSLFPDEFLKTITEIAGAEFNSCSQHLVFTTRTAEAIVTLRAVSLRTDAVPILLDVIPERIEMSNFFKRRAEHRPLKWTMIPTFRSLNCTLNLLLFPDLASLRDASEVWSVLVEKFVNADLDNVMLVLPFFYIVAFSRLNTHSELEAAVAVASKDVVRLMKMHLPPVFILTPSQNWTNGAGDGHDSSENVIIHGWFVCWYCEPSKGVWDHTVTFEYFYCHSNLASECPRVLMNTLKEKISEGRQVEWHFYDYLRSDGVYALRNPPPDDCLPFWSGEKFSYDEGVALYRFLLEPINKSMAAHSSYFYFRGSAMGFPSIAKATIDFLDLLPSTLERFQPLGYEAEFRFLIAHGISAEGSGILEKFLNPFHWNLWAPLAGFCLFTAALYSANGPLPFWPTFVGNVILVIGSMVEQALPEPPRSIAQAWTKSLVLIAWVLALLVLTNAYKGIMKSDYIVEPTYRTNWSKIKELEGFDLYFGINLIPDKCANACDTNFECDHACICDKGSFSNVRETLGRRECQIKDDLEFYKGLLRRRDASDSSWNKNYNQWRENHKNWLTKAVNRVRHIYLNATNSYESVVRILRKPRVAFITPQKFAHADMESVRNSELGPKTLKLTSNLKSEDHIFRSVSGYACGGRPQRFGTSST